MPVPMFGNMYAATIVALYSMCTDILNCETIFLKPMVCTMVYMIQYTQ